VAFAIVTRHVLEQCRLVTHDVDLFTVDADAVASRGAL
jgi:hypothetical protein